MKIIIEGEPKEIAVLVVAIQERPKCPIDYDYEASNLIFERISEAMNKIEANANSTADRR